MTNTQERQRWLQLITGLTNYGTELDLKEVALQALLDLEKIRDIISNPYRRSIIAVEQVLGIPYIQNGRCKWCGKSEGHLEHCPVLGEL